MKVFIVVAAIVLVTACAVEADDMKARFKEVGQMCAKENGVSDEEAEKVHAGLLKGGDVKDNMKCAMNCVMVKMGFMNDAGKFNADAFKTAFNNSDMKEKAAAALEKCKGLEGPNPCETAYLITSCLMKEKMEGV